MPFSFVAPSSKNALSHVRVGVQTGSEGSKTGSGPTPSATYVRRDARKEIERDMPAARVGRILFGGYAEGRKSSIISRNSSRLISPRAYRSRTILRA
jgi:hypothetical protein